MILSPFPYKIFIKDRIKPGVVFSTPKFCSRNADNLHCKNFYKSISGKTGYHICPYGFGVDYVQLGNNSVIFTCLNIEKKSDRKKVQKNLGKQEFIPRLPLTEYERIKNNFISHILDNESVINIEQERSKIEIEKELLDNTIHEIRKLNNQLKGYISKLNYHTQNLRERTDNIDKLNLDIYATTNLMSIRLNTYDLEVNPELNLNSSPKEIAIYKKIEKIYKCLSIETGKKQLSVRLEGNSYNSFFSSDVIEIAFFIILENAIKYSPQQKNIDIIFKEKNDELTLTFKNWGFRPRENELKLLTNRGYRGQIVKDNPDLEGRGIGLHLFKIICDTNNIKYNIRIDDDNYYQDNYRFSPFIVELYFNNMIIGDSVKDNTEDPE
ncbi:MAG: hypothetical protein BGO34_06700 [Bacteroidia bacterium 44-10]|nr:MAG: hypothetical protein BGO34_06700 [Bacteroidia bacterium 44-10]